MTHVVDRVAPRAGFVRNVSVLWISSIVVLATSVVQGIAIARWLGPHDLGVATLVVSYAGAIFAMVGFRSSDASIKYLGEFASRGASEQVLATAKLTYLVDLGAGWVAFVLVVASAAWAGSHVLHVRGMTDLMLLVSVGYLLRSSSSTSQSILLTKRRFKAVGVTQITVALVRMTLVLVLVRTGFGVRGVVIGSAVGLALEGLTLTRLALVTASRSWGSVRTAAIGSLGDERRKLMRFLLWSNYGSLVGLVAKELDVIVLGFFKSSTDVGYYKVAESLVGLGGSVVAPLQSAIFPRFVALWGEGKRRDVGRLARRAALFVGLPLAAIGMAGLVLVAPVVRILVGPSFAPAAAPARILLVGVAVWVGLFWLRPLLLSLGAVRFYAANATVGSALAAAGWFLLVPRWGVVGTAWAQTGSTLVASVVALAFLARRFRSHLWGGEPRNGSASPVASGDVVLHDGAAT